MVNKECSMEFGAGFELCDFFLYLLSSCILFAACVLIDDWNLAFVGYFGL
jgi:hypothetical protein